MRNTYLDRTALTPVAPDVADIMRHTPEIVCGQKSVHARAASLREI